MKNTKNKRFFAEIIQQKDGSFKLKKAQQLTQLNQYRRKWLTVNARELAREITNNRLVTN